MQKQLMLKENSPLNFSLSGIIYKYTILYTCPAHHFMCIYVYILYIHVHTYRKIPILKREDIPKIP